MPTRIVAPTWRDEQDSGNYPFSDVATLVNDAGSVISPGLFLDAHLYIIGAKAPVYMSRLEIRPSLITIYVGDSDNEAVAEVSFEPSDPPTSLLLKDLYNRPAGLLISDATRLYELTTWGNGTHEFTSEQAEFAVGCTLPMPHAGVRGIELEDGSMFFGVVHIVGSDGVVLTSGEETGPPKCGGTDLYRTIRVDVVGDPLARRRLCDGLEYVAPRPVRKLRILNRGETYDLVPDARGNVSIQAGDELSSRPSLRLREQQNGLVFEMLGTAITDG